MKTTEQKKSNITESIENNASFRRRNVIFNATTDLEKNNNEKLIMLSYFFIATSIIMCIVSIICFISPLIDVKVNLPTQIIGMSSSLFLGIASVFYINKCNKTIAKNNLLRSENNVLSSTNTSLTIANRDLKQQKEILSIQLKKKKSKRASIEPHPFFPYIKNALAQSSSSSSNTENSTKNHNKPITPITSSSSSTSVVRFEERPKTPITPTNSQNKHSAEGYKKHKIEKMLDAIVKDDPFPETISTMDLTTFETKNMHTPIEEDDVIPPTPATKSLRSTPVLAQFSINNAYTQKNTISDSDESDSDENNNAKISNSHTI